MAECKKCGEPINIWTTGLGSKLCRACSDAEANAEVAPKAGSHNWLCEHFHKQVSPEAKTCPHCGQHDPATDKMPTEAKAQALLQIGGCLLTVGIVIILGLVLLFVCRFR